MAATKFGFLTQPLSTVQGYRLRGGAAGYSQNSNSILVGNLDANGNIVTTDASVPTIAIGTNPTSGSTISGTLVGVPVNGVSSFTDLAITLGGAGYTLSATGSLTTATSNAFTLASSKRVNPMEVPGTLTAQGQYVGPYRYTGHTIDLRQNSLRLSINGVFSATVQVIVVDPGLDQTVSTNQVIVGTYTAPTSQVFEAGGSCDIYFFCSAYTSGTANCAVFF